jgi:hypothetical protein
VLDQRDRLVEERKAMLENKLKKVRKYLLLTVLLSEPGCNLGASCICLSLAL